MIKTILPPAALCLFLASVAVRAAPPQPLTIYGDDGYPPYSYVEDGQMKGIYTDILREALRAMPQYQVRLLPVPWKRGVLMMQAGDAFALYPPYKLAGERPTVTYSIPLLTEHVVVFCNQDVAARRPLASWPLDYRGLRIGLNAGFLVGDEAYHAAVKSGALVVDAVKGTRSNLLKLMRGRIDCYINDRLSVQSELQRLHGEGQLVPSMLAVRETAQLASQQGYLGYGPALPATAPYRADFIARFNAVIAQMQRSGAIARIVERAVPH
ncbi:substrate-binding periplasmic protein [Janthinobacterium psychrotolerans]|uniref:Polar amino acid transport system substrate-binding protein n=1 Tax=Janthinobacterium psychrotolerans TaxID=1747903 RepID=A0A1A7BTG7_9BURK|nr:transporter substrate-binding domain-containing protein [Janthinobacterium psychrotolerans]OBV36836.1 polar amino acid transport system substrate-binding protein [Janthinobacterium psychrotolerans]